MKTLALLITLVLHTTGLWSHLPSQTKASLTAAGVSTTRATQSFAIVDPTPIGPMPVQTGTEPLTVNAAGIMAIDAATGTPLFTQNSGKRLPIASVTKMVTTLVILSRHSVNDTVTIPKLPTYQTADETIGLIPGEKYKLGDLVRAALIPSANDAADALALYDSGTTAKFAAHMNAKMAEWGIADTRFSNPSGLQDTGNYASAAALAKIATLAIANPFIRQTVNQTETIFTSASGRTFDLKTTDQLLATGQFYGIKTGYTPAAGECFVGLTRIQGHEVITVVLGADDRFGSTQSLVNWIGRNWQWL